MLTEFHVNGVFAITTGQDDTSDAVFGGFCGSCEAGGFNMLSGNVCAVDWLSSGAANDLGSEGAAWC